MNKKLLTIAVGAALVAGPMLTAQAGEVTVYGMVQVELAQEEVDFALNGVSNEFLRTNVWQGGDFSTNTAGDTGSILTLEDNQRGRFGIKASEDLGGGLKGLAVIEYDLGDTTSGGGPTIRTSSVGLGGSFGTFLVGQLKSPYKYTGGITYDPFVTTNLEARRNGGMTGGLFGHNGFISNALSFETKAIPMVNIWVLYSPDENGTDSVNNQGSAVGDKGDYAAAVKVGDKAWEAFVATSHNADNTGAGDTYANDYTAFKVGGKVSIGKMHTILAQYEKTDADISAPNITQEGKILFVGYHLKLGNTKLIGQVGKGELEQSNSTVTQEHMYYTVGAVHNFSKTTRVFGGYTSTSVDNENGALNRNGDRTAISLGLRKDF
jgi:predicted porin